MRSMMLDPMARAAVSHNDRWVRRTATVSLWSSCDAFHVELSDTGHRRKSQRSVTMQEAHSFG